jgi:phosphoglycerate kinase
MRPGWISGREPLRLIRGDRARKNILWNGPVGLFEDKRFAKAPMQCARNKVTQQHGAKSIISGGDSVKALNKAKLGDGPS